MKDADEKPPLTARRRRVLKSTAPRFTMPAVDGTTDNIVHNVFASAGPNSLKRAFDFESGQTELEMPRWKVSRRGEASLSSESEEGEGEAEAEEEEMAWIRDDIKVLSKNMQALHDEFRALKSALAMSSRAGVTEP